MKELEINISKPEMDRLRIKTTNMEQLREQINKPDYQGKILKRIDETDTGFILSYDIPDELADKLTKNTIFSFEIMKGQ